MNDFPKLFVRYCKACDCFEDIRDIPIQSGTSCLITPEKSGKRWKYEHSSLTKDCREVKTEEGKVMGMELKNEFNKGNGSVVFSFNIKMIVSFEIPNFVY